MKTHVVDKVIFYLAYFTGFCQEESQEGKESQRMELRERIRTFIIRHILTSDKKLNFSDSDDIFAAGFVSSLLAVQLVNFIQEECGVSLDETDITLRNFSTVNSIVRLVQIRQEQSGP